VDISTVADSAEISALFTVADSLVNEDIDHRGSTIKGLLTGLGEVHGVSCMQYSL